MPRAMNPDAVISGGTALPVLMPDRRSKHFEREAMDELQHEVRRPAANRGFDNRSAVDTRTEPVARVERRLETELVKAIV